jgi:hypothetical protein
MPQVPETVRIFALPSNCGEPCIGALRVMQWVYTSENRAFSFAA